MRPTLHPLLAVLALVASLAVAGCGGPSVTQAREAAGTVNGLCPVREEPVEKGAHIVFEGQKIGFCCPPCSGEFRREPERYLQKMRAERERFAYTGT